MSDLNNECFYKSTQLYKDLMAVCDLYQKSDEELSSVCNVPVSEVRNWRYQRSDIPIESVYRLTKFLGVDINNMIKRRS